MAMASAENLSRMEPLPARRFHAGGVVPLGQAFYVERAADDRLVAELLQGRLCYILGTRQIGKSSLRVRAMTELRRRGARAASLNLQGFGFPPEAEWYRGLIQRAAKELELPFSAPEFFARHAHSGPVHLWTSFFHEEVLPHIDAPVVIFFDEIDTVLSPDFRFSTDAFFASLRSLYEEVRGSFSKRPRLTFCLIGVATPEELIKDPVRSPFNLDNTRLLLDDFTPRQAEVLLPGLVGLPGSATEWLAAVMAWTDGHPYMTQRLCQQLVDRSPPEPGPIAELVKAAVTTLFLSGHKDPNLSFAEAQFQHISDHHDRHSVVTLYRRIYVGDRVLYEPQDRLQSLLLLSGMVKLRADGEERRLIARNRIFREVFGAKWIQERDRTTPDWLTDKLFAYWESGRSAAQSLSRIEIERALDTIPKSGQSLPPDLAEFIGRSQHVRDREERRQRTIFALAVVGLLSVLPFAAYQTYRRVLDKKEAAVRESQINLLQEYRSYAEQQIEKLTTRLTSLEGEVSELYAALKDADRQLLRKERELGRLKLQKRESEQRLAVLRREQLDVQSRLQKRNAELQLALRDRQEHERVRLNIDARLRDLEPAPAQVKTPPLPPAAQTLKSLLSQVAPKKEPLPFPESQALRQAVTAMGGLRLPFLRVREPGLHLLKLCPFARGTTGKPFVLAASSGGVSLWDAEGQPLPAEFALPEGAVVRALATKYRCSQVMVSIDGRVLAFNEQGLLMNQLRSQVPARVLTALVSPDDDPPQGFPVVMGLGDRAEVVYLRQGGHKLGAQLPHVDEVTAVDLSQNGQLLLTAAGRRVLLWQVVSGERLRTLHEHPAKVRAVALSHAMGDSVAVSAADDGSVSVLSTTRGEQQLSLSGHRGAVRSAEFSIDGHYIVTASADRSVRVWAIKDGQPVFALQDLPQPPLSAELSADGKQLVILLADGEARLYSVSDRDFISAGCTKLRTMTTVPGCS
jgi:hypothetical protein